MEEIEDRLQAGLDGLESGKPLEDLQKGVPENEGVLLELAECLRSVEWPERDPKQVESQRKQTLVTYDREINMKSQKNQPSTWFKGWRLPVLLSAGVMVLVCGLVLVIGLGLLLRGNRQVASSDNPKFSHVVIEDAEARSTAAKQISAQQAVLVNPRGLVEIRQGEIWQALQAGAFLEVGAQVRTSALSSAALLFKDGSSVLLGPSSELVIEALNANADGAAREIVLTQLAGRSEHNVAAVKAEGSRYLVQTPYGDAVAHGTAFHVRVSDVQAALYVTEGTVEMTGKDTSVMVDAGQMTSVGMDDDPLHPTSFITGMGEVTFIGDTWIIAGQTFVTHVFTLVVGNPQVGDIAFFEAHLLDDGTRVADMIILVRRNPSNTFSLTGTVEAIGDPLWTINGQEIAVTDLTEVEEGIVAGNLVLVNGLVMADGTLQAMTIRLMEDQPGTPFDFTGVVQQTGETEWLVLDVPIAVNNETVIDEGLIIGDLVRVQGWILEDDTWLAGSIHRVLDENSSFEFLGKIESINPWVVAGIDFETRDWTVIDESLAVGELVLVKGQILEDGTWVAYEVSRYDQTLTTILIGRVFSMAPWIVSGVTLNVDGETQIASNITIGMLVRVELVLLPDGTHRVVRIDPVDGYEWEEGCQTLVVRVVGVDGNQIQLEGWPALQMSEDIQIEGDLREGAIVQVTICFNEDMTVRVITIVILYSPEAEEPPTSDESTKVMICHKPNGKNPHIILVSQSAVPAHLGHGDILGPCP
jgi:mannose-6-phosphate isomerase-like protein (cupin superfamily)